MAIIVSRIAALRKRRRIAGAALGSAAGVSRQTIYAMEAGEYIPNTAVALKLARQLESTVEELFRLEPDAPAAHPAEFQRRAGEPVAAADQFRACHPSRGRLVGVAGVPVPWRLAPADGLLVNPV